MGDRKIIRRQFCESYIFEVFS
jgi:hypothetical protein